MQTKNTNLSKKTGFAMAELMVVIAVLSILMVLLLPVFAAAQDRAHRSICTSNLHQVALALKMYANDYDGVYPLNHPNSHPQKKQCVWDMLAPYARNPQIFHCPDEHTSANSAPGYQYRVALWNDPATLAQKSLRPDSGTVVAICAEHAERNRTGALIVDPSGHQVGSLTVAHEDGSVTHVMAEEVDFWAYHRGYWRLRAAACPIESVCVERYPGEAWPPSL
jgi:prepilin-type N-terminal cleavage/methylation domain-containing protein